MGYILLWIESLAVSLLLVATLVACIGRLRRRWVRVVLSVLVMLVPLAAYAGLTSLAGAMKFAQGWPGTRFYQLLTLTMFYTVGAAWILCRGLRRRDEENRWAVAGSWPRRKLAIALGVAIALHLTTFWNLDLAARQWLAAQRAEAGALALSVAPPRVPDRDNAALIYQQALEVMGPVESRNDGWDQKWEGWVSGKEPGFDPQEPKLREFLRQQTPVLILLRQAAQKPGCYFDRSYARPDPINLSVSELYHLRMAARLLSLDARVKAADGDLEAALVEVQAMFAMAQHVSSEPILISLLTSIAIERMAADTLEATLGTKPASPLELGSLHVDPAVSYARCLAQAFRMEEAFDLSMCCQMGVAWDLSMFDPGSTGGIRGAASLYRVFLLSEDVATLRQTMLKLHALAVQPYYRAKNDWQRLDKEVRGESGGFLARSLLPALLKCAEAAAEGDARHRVVLVAVALCRYRAAHNRFPDKLEDLTPEFLAAVPRDPFDGKPLKLKRTHGGLVIYSIGRDLADNGGTPLDREEKAGDVTFTLVDSG